MSNNEMNPFPITFGQEAVDNWTKAKEEGNSSSKMKLVVVPTVLGGKTVAYVPSEMIGLVDKFKSFFGFGNCSLKKLSQTIVQRKIESSDFADKVSDFNDRTILGVRKIDSVIISELRNNSYKVMQRGKEHPPNKEEIEHALKQIEANPENSRHLIAQLADAFSKNRYPDLSSRLLTVAMDLHVQRQDDAFFALVCGKILTQRGKLDEAEVYVIHAHVRDSTNRVIRDALIDLSKGYTEKAQSLFSASAGFDKIKEKIEKALKHDPINGNAYLLLIDVDPNNKYEWLGKAKECVVSLQKNNREEEASELDKIIRQLPWESITVEIDTAPIAVKEVDALSEYAGDQYIFLSKLEYPVSEADIYIHLDEFISSVKDVSLKDTLRDLQSKLDELLSLQLSNLPIPHDLQQGIDTALHKINEFIKTAR